MKPENMAVRQAADAVVEASVKWGATHPQDVNKSSRTRELETAIRRYNEAKKRLTDTYRPAAGQMTVDDYPEVFT